MGVCEGLAARLDALVEKVIAKHFELGPGEGLYKVLRDTVYRHYVRQVDLS